ncbi:beta-catenin-like protein 1 [Belonocnema kinseyi]|uniref:beta-catenin-like protein 1 n=1 Tax=Belonocnema kinseyi TaxID=2817044 RepID=UPI00143D7301|nr:beta-catenin-like protein 1 [Belonocnema kinseyi]
MDIGELLSYKPPNTPKRALPEDLIEDEEEDEWENVKRRKKVIRTPYHPRMRQREIEGTPVRGTPIRGTPLRSIEPPTPIRSDLPYSVHDVVETELTDKEKEDILKYVETEAVETEVLDEGSLKRMILLFEKRALRNQEMRVKFPDQPEKFMESEIELHETIQELRQVSTTPDLYPTMVELSLVPSLLELLAHENTDIAVGIVTLLQDLTDMEDREDTVDSVDSLIDALVEQQVFALLVQNLERLDEAIKEESDGVHNTMAIFENILEFRPILRTEAGKQGLMQWLLKRIKAKMPYDANKLYASELLSILLQDSKENATLLGELDGVDVLLQQLAYYKRHDPQSADEQEMMENLFNVLCSSLLLTVNKERFLRGEGLQLMNLMLREKKMSRNGSLKVLSYAMNGLDGKDNCNKFVDILGLRTIFPLFMKTPTKNRKKLLPVEQHEEYVVWIIASMLKNCKGTQRQRLLSKFTENDFEKVDRLMELHFKYLEKVEEIEKEAQEESDEEESYLKRLDNGLFILQGVDYILVEACAGCPPTVKQRVTRILSQRRASLKTIRHIMREYAGNLGDAADPELKEAEQQHILQLIDKF